jgi:Gram-negative bacterial TonB protein C-terminal
MKNFTTFLLLLLSLSFCQAQGTSSQSVIYNKTSVQIPPQFPGGLKEFYGFIDNNFSLPAAQKGTDGEITAVFVVEQDGSLTSIKMLRHDYGNEIGKEVIRVLQLSPKWLPAELEGQKVRCQYSLPIAF